MDRSGREHSVLPLSTSSFFMSRCSHTAFIKPASFVIRYFTTTPQTEPPQVMDTLPVDAFAAQRLRANPVPRQRGTRVGTPRVRTGCVTCEYPAHSCLWKPAMFLSYLRTYQCRQVSKLDAADLPCLIDLTALKNTACQMRRDQASLHQVPHDFWHVRWLPNKTQEEPIVEA
jgi:hypothetical protein